MTSLAKTLLPAVALILAGCGNHAADDADKSAVQPVKPTAAPLAPANGKPDVWTNNPVVIRIDGKSLTKRDVIRNGKVMLTLNLNKARRTKLGKRDWAYLSRYCRDTAEREIGRAAVKRYLDERGLTPPTNLIATTTRDFTRRYGIKSKKLKRWHTIDDLKFMIGKKSAFRVDEELQARIDYATATNDMIRSHAEAVAVTDDAVRKRLDIIRDYNFRAQATNACTYAKATNVWREVTAETNRFEALAKDVSEDEYIANGCDWGLFSMTQLAEETALLKLLPTMKPGDITPPIESDGGLAVVRLDETDSQGNLAFSRIFFRLPMFYDEETPETARAEIRRQNERELVSKILKDFAAKLKIDYPDGTNVFGDVKSPVVTPREYETCTQ